MRALGRTPEWARRKWRAFVAAPTLTTDPKFQLSPGPSLSPRYGWVHRRGEREPVPKVHSGGLGQLVRWLSLLSLPGWSSLCLLAPLDWHTAGAQCMQALTLPLLPCPRKQPASDPLSSPSAAP